MKFKMKRGKSDSWRPFFLSNEPQNSSIYNIDDPAVDVALCAISVRKWWDIPLNAEWNLILTKRKHPDAYKCRLIKGTYFATAEIQVWYERGSKWMKYAIIYNTYRKIYSEFGNEVFYARAEVYE
jgi:hypothetical protein